MAVAFVITVGLLLTKMAELLISFWLMFCSTNDDDYVVYDVIYFIVVGNPLINMYFSFYIQPRYQY